MKKIIICLCILMVSLVGCEEESPIENSIESRENNLIVWTVCADNVICYRNQMGIGSGVSCFRDDDLVAKYC